MLSAFGEAVRHIPTSFELGDGSRQSSFPGIVRNVFRRLGRSGLPTSYRGPHDVVVGVDPLGICVAARLNQRARRPLSYISFELLFEDETETDYERELKARERQAVSGCDLFLLQDEGRRDAFCLENGVAAHACELVPVAPVDAHPPRTDYLRDRLGLGPDVAIVLYQGSLYDWSCRHEFEELASYWPDNVRLVIHSREAPRRRMRKYMAAMEAGGRIRFTAEPVSPPELAVLTASADVGLASYRTSPDNWYTGDNLKHIGLSSGKISYYAMAGLPVLARSLPSTDRVLEAGGFGASYAKLADSAGALQRILASRDAMGRAARRFYEERLDPSIRVSRYCDRLLALGAGR